MVSNLNLNSMLDFFSCYLFTSEHESQTVLAWNYGSNRSFERELWLEFKGYIFCLGGIFFLTRNESEQMTKNEFWTISAMLGCLVTTSLDETTDYLVLGSKLED